MEFGQENTEMTHSFNNFLYKGFLEPRSRAVVRVCQWFCKSNGHPPLGISWTFHEDQLGEVLPLSRLLASLSVRSAPGFLRALRDHITRYALGSGLPLSAQLLTRLAARPFKLASPLSRFRCLLVILVLLPNALIVKMPYMLKC